MARPAQTSRAPDAEERICLVLQRLIVLGGVTFFCSFASWILWYVLKGDPFARVLGPVVIALLLSIMSFALIRGVWVVCSLGRTRATVIRPARVAAAAYLVRAERRQVDASKYCVRLAPGTPRARAAEVAAIDSRALEG